MICTKLGIKEMDERVMGSKIRDGRGRCDLTLHYTETAATIAASKQWLQCSGLGLQLQNKFVAASALCFGGEEREGGRGRGRGRGRGGASMEKRGDEEVSSYWLCVRERGEGKDMAAIFCMDACN
jgi:hypothetical protein